MWANGKYFDNAAVRGLVVKTYMQGADPYSR